MYFVVMDVTWQSHHTSIFFSECHSCHKTLWKCEHFFSNFPRVYILLPQMPWMSLDSLTLPVFAYLKGVYNFSMPQLPQDLVTISTVFFQIFRRYIFCCHRYHGCNLTVSPYQYLHISRGSLMPQLPQDFVTIWTVFFKFSEGIYFVATDAMAATWQSHLTSICISQGGV